MITEAYELSPWHDGDVKPVHVGVYERYSFGNCYYNFFDGKVWYWGSMIKENALLNYTNSHDAHYYQNLPWRGVLK